VLSRLVSYESLGCGHVYLALRSDAAECPFQFVVAQLICTLERLPEHGDLRGAIPAELGGQLDGSYDVRICDLGASHLRACHFPLAKDQALRTGAACSDEQSHGGH